MPKSEPYYLPAESARVVAGDNTLLHQGVAHPTGRERRVPAAAGCPPIPAPGSGDPMPMEVDPTPIPIRPEAVSRSWDPSAPRPLFAKGQGHRNIPAAAGRPPTPPTGPERSYAAAAATPFSSPLLRDGGRGGILNG